ncbi:MAG: hypothetical protein ACK559_08125, partial [bacterium]
MLHQYLAACLEKLISECVALSFDFVTVPNEYWIHLFCEPERPDGFNLLILSFLDLELITASVAD